MLTLLQMAYTGQNTSGNNDPNGGFVQPAPTGPKVLGARVLFQKKLPGSPGKLGKSSTKAESLSKLRGKGAIS